MYSPSHFEESRLDVVQQFIHDHAFGSLITLDGSTLNADHLPFEIDRHSGPFGVLRAHVARANPLWKKTSPDVESLALFQGPDAYVSPSWYASKKENHKVVPTWNYMVVHAYGPLRVVDDPVWLLGLVERLTNRHEATTGAKGDEGRAAPWKVSDAPADYIQKMLGAIIGIEIPITRLVGKWKVSQNRSEADRRGVAMGLRDVGGSDNTQMADAVDR